MASGEQTVELKEMLITVLGKLDTVSSQMENLGKRIEVVEQKVNHIERKTDHLHGTLSNAFGKPKPRNLYQEVTAVRETITVMDFYHSQFRKNMAIRGIVEYPEEDIDLLVRRFLNDKLSIGVDKINNMTLFCHRMPRIFPEDVHAPIYVKFADMDSMRYVQGKAEKRKKDLLADNIRTEF